MKAIHVRANDLSCGMHFQLLGFDCVIIGVEMIYHSDDIGIRFTTSREKYSMFSRLVLPKDFIFDIII